MRDPRVDLSGELLPDHAVAAVNALDARRIVIDAGAGPAAALTAGSLLVLVARTHAHVDLTHDVPLPRNPWGTATLNDLLETLNSLRPPNSRTDGTAPAETTVISTGTVPGADRYLAPAQWSVAVTTDLDTHLDHLRQLGITEPADATEATGTGGTGVLACAPYGGMLGAAVVAADLFCESLAPLGLPAAERRDTFVWNLIDFTYSLAPDDTANAADADHDCDGDGAGVMRWPRLLFAGCGSVGSAAAATLACDDLDGLEAISIDNDDFDATRNPYRYPASTPVTDGPKATWVADMLTSAGADATSHNGPVHTWTTSQPTPGFDGIVIASVDTIDGRYEVADILARTTLSAAVRALAFHVQREHLGDGHACPFCDFVTAESTLTQSAADAALTGLPEQRIIELHYHHTGLEQQDLDMMVQAGKLTPETAAGLLGARVADMRHRLYAQAVIPAAGAHAGANAAPAPLSAPFVSWAVGVLLACEVAKAARSLPAINRRVELDLHGYPGNYAHQFEADRSGRCACARPTRTRWMRRLYDDADTGSAIGEPTSAAPALHISTATENDPLMTMHPVTSDEVRAVGYDPRTRTMRVQFLGGRTYEYDNVDPALFEQMLLPHPWRRVGRLVRTHHYRPVAA